MGKKKPEEVLEDLPVIAGEIGLEAEELPMVLAEPDAEEAALDEPATEPAYKEPVIATPEADITFDTAMATAWLNNGYCRRSKAYTSIRFDAIDLSERRMSEALRLAAQAVKVGGELFVPNSLLHLMDFHVENETYALGDAIGNYVSYRRAI